MDGETRMTDHHDGTNNTYCNLAWRHFWEPYNSSDNYVKIIVCGIGVITNALNIWIFTRSRMRRINPQLNLIFLALSLSDFAGTLRKFLELFLYLYRKSYGGDSRMRYRKTLDKLLHDLFFNLFHSWSVWLTVVVAGWIYFSMTDSNFTTKVKVCCSRCFCGLQQVKRKAEWTIFVTILGATVIVSLMYLDVKLTIIERTYNGHPKNNPHYIIDRNKGGMQLYHASQMLLIKLIPCTILTILTIKNISALKKSNREFKVEETGEGDSINFTPKFLTSQSNFVQNFEDGDVRLESQSGTEIDEKTIKLVTVMSILFLLTEFPSAIFRVTAGLSMSIDFLYECYMPPFHFFQLNEFLSSALNLFVYVSMDPEFKAILKIMFRNCFNFFLCKENNRICSRKPNSSTANGNHDETMRNNHSMSSSAQLSTLTIMEDSGVNVSHENVTKM